jgi:VanZ family protein
MSRSALRRTVLGLLVPYWLLACILTHLPARFVTGAQIGDKLEHFLSFGLLSGLLYLYLWLSRPRLTWTPVVVLAIALAYGAVDEWTQPWFNRTCDFQDWTADAAAAAAAVVVLGLLHWAVSAGPPSPVRAEET